MDLNWARAWRKGVTGAFAKGKATAGRLSRPKSQAEAPPSAGAAPPAGATARPATSILARLAALPVRMGITRTRRKAPVRPPKKPDKPAAAGLAPRKTPSEETLEEFQRARRGPRKSWLAEGWVGPAAGGLAIGLALLYGLYWYSALKTARAGMDRWIAAERQRGYAFSADKVSFGGFPFALRLFVGGPQVTAPGGIWRWQGEVLRGETRPWRPTHLHLWFPGQHRFVLGAHDVTLSAAQATLEADFPAWHQIDLVIEGLTRGPAPLQQPVADRLSLSLTALPDEPAPAPDSPRMAPRYAGQIALANLALPVASEQPLGDRLQALTAGFTLQGALPRGALKPSVAAWRDEGGTLELEGLRLQWGPLALALTGTLALDGNMQPLLAGSAQVSGYFEALDALVASGALGPRDGAMIKVVLGLLARSAGAQPMRELSVPVTIQDQRLYLGNVSVGEIPAILW